MEISFETYIREHYKELKFGVDSNFIKKVNIEGLTYNNIVQKLLPKYCDKYRSTRNGKQCLIYRLRPEVFQGIRETKPNEPIKYVGEERFNKPKPIKKKSIIKHNKH